jgi:hypothetical protein
MYIRRFPLAMNVNFLREKKTSTFASETGFCRSPFSTMGFGFHRRSTSFIVISAQMDFDSHILFHKMDRSCTYPSGH